MAQDEFQKYIGYEFNDPDILKEAQTRRAFNNEKPDAEYMDALATLGDAVLDTVVIFRLYENGEREKGKLTQKKELNVKREKTRKFAKDNNLGQYIHWGKGESADETCKDSARALDTVTEALIGAVYLDAEKQYLAAGKSGEHGMCTVRKMLERMKFFDPDT
jgi:ribonuclease-3